MVSMKLEKEGKSDSDPIEIDQPDYPYGLLISLDEKSMKKLGISMKNAGDECIFVCKAKVKSTSKYDNESGKSQEMSLQITDMDVDKEPDLAGRAKQLYGEEKT